MRWVLGLMVLMAIGAALFHVGTTQGAQLVPVNVEDITQWLYDHIVKPVEDFISWLWSQILRVLQAPFDIIYNVLNTFGEGVRSIFELINRALSDAFREFFWG